MFDSLLAATCIAMLSVAGAFVFRKHNHITGTHRFIVPVALGMFLGIVFFELIPETLEQATDHLSGGIAIVFGFLAFYLLSHFLRTYHHHHHDDCHSCVPKHRAHLLLIGDGIHNISDGVVISAAFLVNPALGIVTTIGVALHEIPQEIAEYGLLLQAGFSKTKALLYNLVSASSIILGVLLSFTVLQFGDYIWILTGVAAGNLLYIAAADMIPELHGQEHQSHFLTTFVSLLIGLIFMVGLLEYAHGIAPHEHDEVIDDHEHETATNDESDHHDEELDDHIH